jgi:hypothetical protein
MKRIQQISAALTLTIILGSAAMAGTITGSKTGTITGSKTGTITGSKSGTITGSKVADANRKGIITGSRTESEENVLTGLVSLFVSLAW